jgi:hypothetical protein
MISHFQERPDVVKLEDSKNTHKNTVTEDKSGEYQQMNISDNID